MSYCLNPTCPHPENSESSLSCKACGSRLLLCDRYRVLKPLGQGGFGATFLAKDMTLPGEPTCVIKQLRPTGKDPRTLQMARDLFEREAKTLGKIGNHPQIPSLLNYFEDHEHFYLVQEYISGYTIQEEIKKQGPYSEVAVRQFLTEILPLLEYIHEQKVIHRDIKPANLIRRSQDARMVLIDFGAVKDKVSQTPSSQSEHTAFTAYAIGTPGFAPPEQMAMRPVYASDIYAVGVTCIYLLTGKKPNDLDYDPKTGEMLWEDLVELSPHLIKVLKQMLDVSVRNRYQSSKEVLQALEMEPYLESLGKGLLVKSNSGLKDSTNNNQDNSAILSDYSATNSSFAQQAAAIRARKAKNKDITGVRTGITQSEKSKPKSISNSISNKNISAEERKIDAHTLLTAYLNGRRDFASFNLNMLRLAGADLSGTNFHAAQLQKVNLQGAKLNNCDFGMASLIGAILQDANLQKAYLSHADLEGANLRGADLSFAYLNNANLRGANLSGANLTGAKVTEEQLALAKTNWLTVRPNGKRGLL
ncbi:serine/threonine-protein kinase [Cronbergia sp. UHCC 0137]|uniref:serine/threonine-protein kinase n=1 Tax=Cronbergia sp. UHCC 0137 TaxID=3110239 RepID=UPI002B21B499|nr:serine/threonine-protein kinase [Cronbergia sp. UHCC 0137]MEA5619129.1 serine/threonine-protein kinase [Cronbergia sp. UHCC 0137]